jgi:hypothetical protein
LRRQRASHNPPSNIAIGIALVGSGTAAAGANDCVQSVPEADVRVNPVTGKPFAVTFEIPPQ